MKSLDSRGSLNVLMLPLIILTIFFLGMSGFAFWAFGSRQDYKEHSDRKVAEAVSIAQKETQDADAAKFAEEAKKPLDTYIGPAAYGNITVKYPKTWSAYVAESEGDGSTPINGYFHPSYVPNLQENGNAYALRVQLVSQSYDTILAQFNGQVTSKKVTVAPYTLEKVPSVVGSRIEGQIKPNKQGTMVILPLRNMTLEIWTEQNNFKTDFDSSILPNLSFVP